MLSIAGILQVLHKTDVEEKFEKGDYCRKAQNHPEECILLGRKFDFRAINSAPGPEFLPLDKISGGQKFLIFHPFEIRLSPLLGVVVQRSVKGPEILVWAEFPGAGNSIISAPAKFG
jgi:hypothetical protein